MGRDTARQHPMPEIKLSDDFEEYAKDVKINEEDIIKAILSLMERVMKY